MRRRGLTVLFIALAMIIPYTAQAAPSPGEEHPPSPLADRNGNQISDGLEEQLENIGPGQRLDVIVTWEGPPDVSRAEEHAGELDIRRQFTAIDGFAASVTAAQVKALARVPGVFRVEEDFQAFATIEEADADYGTEGARADFGVTGAGINACVLDTGADPNHEQLDNGKIRGFFDVINGQTTAYDDHDHGTHVSAILAGDGEGPSDDAARYGGVAPDAGLYVAKVLSSEGSGSATGIIEGMEWCMQQDGVRLLSMSLATASGSDGQDSLSQAANNAAAAGFVVVVAAGNSGDGTETVGAPGAAEDALTIGAAGKFARGLHLAPFSSRGPTLDGRLKPDTVAPGVAIVSADANTTSGYFAASGTSMATPFVAGSVALVLDADPALDPVGVKSLVQDTSTDLGVTGADANWGHGLVDGYGAVAVAVGSPVGERSLPGRSLLTGTVPDNGDSIHAVSVGSEEAGEPLAITLLIEGQMQCSSFFFGICLAYEWSPDLDARLIAPDGTTLDSRCPLEGNCGSAGQQETFIVAAAQQGNYTLEVYPYDGSPNNGQGGDYLAEVFVGSAQVMTDPGSENEAPVAVDDAYTTDEDVPLDVAAGDGVLANDTDADGDLLAASLVSGPDAGTLELNENGSFAYTPEPDFHGDDTFTYEVSDGEATDQGTVRMTVNPINDAPAAVDDAYTVGEGETLSVAAPGVLDNDTDVDGDPLTASVVTQPSSGTLNLNEDGSFLYTPSDGFSGEDAFTYEASDGEASDRATVAITVEPAVEDPPPEAIHVGDLDGESDSMRNMWHAVVTVAIHDGSENPVEGADVTFSVSTGDDLTCSTDEAGTCSVTSTAVPKRESTITFVVDSVGAGDPYDAEANHDPDGDSDGTRIVVSK